MAKNVEFKIVVDSKQARRATEVIEDGFEDVEAQVERTDREIKGMSSGLKGMSAASHRSSQRTTSALADISASARQYLGAAGLAGIAGSAGLAVTRGFQRMMNKGSEFEQQLADLEAITGITGDDLQQLGDRALQSSEQYGEAASNIVEAQKLVASQLAEEIDFETQTGIDELKEIADQAIVLQKAAGISLQEAVGATTKTINQFSLSANDAAKVTNVLAAGAKFGAAEVDFLSRALEEAGIGAAGAGEDIETTVAALEVLAKNGIMASKAGTGLRNVFTILQGETEKLAEQGIHNLNIEQDGLIESLRKAKPLLNDAAALNRVFGREVSNAARALLNGVDSIEELEGQITGTNIAAEQAEIQLGTYEGATKQLAATLDSELIQAFQETNGVMVKTINVLTKLVSGTGDAINRLNEYAETEAEVASQLGATNYLWQQQFGILADITNALNLTESEEQVRQWIATQREATQAIDDQVRLLQEDIKFFSKQAEVAEDGSQAQADYTRQIGNSAAELGVLRGQLESQRNSLKQTLNSTEEGSTAYERLEFQLGEVEKRLNIVTTAQERYRVSSHNTAQQIQTEIANTNDLGGTVADLQKKRKAAVAEADKMLTSSEALTEADKNELDSLREKIRALEREIQSRRELAKARELAARGREVRRETESLSRLEQIDVEQSVTTEQDKPDPLQLETVTIPGSIDYMQERLRGLRKEFEAAASDDSRKQIADEMQQVEHSIDSMTSSAYTNTDAIRALGAQMQQSYSQAITQSALYAESADEAAKSVVKALFAEIVAFVIRSAITSLPFPLNLAAATGAAGAALGLRSLIPDFEEGGQVRQEGGILRGRRHRDGGIPGRVGERPIEMEGDEFVVNRRSTRQALPLLERINENEATAAEIVRQIEVATELEDGSVVNDYRNQSEEVVNNNRFQAGGAISVPASSNVTSRVEMVRPPQSAPAANINRGMIAELSRAVATSVRRGLADANISAPVRLKTIDDGLKKQRRINEQIGI